MRANEWSGKGERAEFAFRMKKSFSQLLVWIELKKLNCVVLLLLIKLMKQTPIEDAIIKTRKNPLTNAN